MSTPFRLLQGVLRKPCVTWPRNPYRCYSVSSSETFQLKRRITSLTEKTRHHLTPELQLHLITPSCSLWHSPGKESPFEDPFWAFYWPGGQALTRYILDNPRCVENSNVLDVGCGCGASAIAAAKRGARSVTANDICAVAVTATQLNADLNNASLSYETKDLIGHPCSQWDVVFLGDMFYDRNFTDRVLDWLKTLRRNGKHIMIGDPGRIFLLQHPLRKHLTKLASYELHPDNKQENNGLTEGHVWKFELCTQQAFIQ